MIRVNEIVLERIEIATGEVEIDNRGVLSDKALEATGFTKRFIVKKGVSLFDLALGAASKIPKDELVEIGGVIAATFSNERRFPQLSVAIASALGLNANIPAFDIQMACSAYPYALYLAGRMAADTGRKILVLDGDIQSALSDPSDVSTTPLFTDAMSATIVSAGEGNSSFVDFYSKSSDILSCEASGPIKMDGFGVFSFVACEVVPFLKRFLTEANEAKIDVFVPHQANMYMVRQLANSLALNDKLYTSGEEFANPGSASIPLTIAKRGVSGRVFIAGFGAGLSASAAIVTVKKCD